MGSLLTTTVLSRSRCHPSEDDLLAGRHRPQQEVLKFQRGRRGKQDHFGGAPAAPDLQAAGDGDTRTQEC